jgi:hypothetical protein
MQDSALENIIAIFDTVTLLKSRRTNQNNPLSMSKIFNIALFLSFLFEISAQTFQSVPDRIESWKVDYRQ